MKFILLALSVLLASCDTEVDIAVDTNADVAVETAVVDQPNILLIIGDDMGFSDLGVYGSEVATPNIDALASEGLRFTNFHVGATCSPTRSLLMTGVDNRGGPVCLDSQTQFYKWIPAHRLSSQG